MSNEKFKVKFGLAVGDTAATIDGTTGNIAMGGTMTTIGATNLVLNTNNGTNSGQIQITQGTASNILITPNTSGDVYLESDTVFVGDNNNAATISTYGDASLTISNGSGSNNIVIDPSSGTTVNDGHMILGQLNTNAILTTNGTGNLDIRTGSWPTSANITLADGVNGNITVTTNGTGQVVINAKTDVDELQVDNININGNTISSTDTNGNITLAPNGSGSVALTLADGGNLTNTRNYVKGTIRNSTLAAAGEIWAVNSTGPVSPFQGISIDNSADTTTGPGQVLRSFSGGAVSGSATRGRFIFEKARGTSASPTAVQTGDQLGSIDATGYSSTGWINDTVTVVPTFFGFTASENWVSNTNLGTSFTLSQAPTATTITSAANLISTLQIQPEVAQLRADRFAISQGKTIAFTATGCSTSGTTLTIGTLVTGTVAVGQVLTATNAINGQYILANISGSGSGSTWRLGGSPGTLTGQSISGSAGYIGSVPVTNNSIDMLKQVRLISPTISNAVASDNLQLYNYATKVAYASTENTSGNFLTLKPGQYGGSTAYDKQTEISVVQNTSDGSNFASFEVKTQRFNGTNYAATVSGDSIGRFLFNGNYSTTTSPAVNQAGASLTTYATETWTNLVAGTRMVANITKTGTNTGLEVASLASTAATFKSDSYNFQDSNSTAVTSAAINYTRTYGEVAYTNAAGFNIPAQNTIYTMPLDTTLNASGVTISGTGDININVAGWYKIIMSLQITLTGSGSAPGQIDFWLRKNGADVTNSKTQVDLLKDQKAVIAMDWLVNSDGNDYWEIVYVGTTSNYADIDFPTVAATTTPYVSPLAPALLVNVIPAGM